MHPAEIEATRAALETSERFVSRRGAFTRGWDWAFIPGNGIRLEALETSELMSRRYTPRQRNVEARRCRDVTSAGTKV